MRRPPHPRRRGNGQPSLVPERKPVDESLRESEERFRAVAQLSSDWYWEQDADFRFIRFEGRDVGPNLVHDPARIIGKRRWETSAALLEGTWDEHRKLLEARQPYYDLEFRITDDRGREHFVTASGLPVFDDDGTFKGYRGTGHDITARKRAEELLKLEHAVARAITEADSVSGALKAVIRAVCEAQGWECGRYYRPDLQAGVLRFAEAWAKSGPQFDVYVERFRRITYAPGVGLLGRVWQSEQPIWVADLTRDDRVWQRSIPNDAGLHAAFIFPVVSEGKPIGVIAFNSREIREPDEHLLQATRVIGSQIGQFVQRKKYEDELRRFRASMDMSGDMILLVDRKTMRFIDVNETVCRNLGYSREELLGMVPEDILPMTRDALETLYDEMIATGATQGMRSYYRCKDGSTLPFESMRRVMRSGEDWIIVVSARDIRKHLAQEEALRKSNERFDMAVRATSDVIRDWDLVTDELWWNENFTKVFGHSSEMPDRSVKSWYERIHPDDQGRVIAGVHRLIGSGGENWSDEYRFRRSDGSFAHVLDRGHVIRDGERAVRMIGAMADISSRKRAEERIHTQALQQRLIAEFGQQAFASADVDDALSRAVELVSVTLKAEYCSVLELEPDGKQLVIKAASGWSGEYQGRRTVPIRPGGRLEFVLSRREPLAIGDLTADPRFMGSPLLKLGVRSGIQVPIFGTTGTFGILSAHALEARHFSEEDVTFLQSIANILAVAIQRKSAEQRLAYLAQFDALTGLPNRHLFHDRLLQTIAHARRSGHPMAVLFIDLDRFKLVNDTQGHSAGDKLLKEAAARLSECVRGVDTVGRFGGDEFGAIVSDLSKPGDAGVVAQKVLDAIAQPFKLDARDTYVSASVGITLFPADGDNPEALVMNADTAMYRAKEQGRNTYQYFTREMNERALARVQMEAAMRRAIERGEFLLYYQPKVDLKSRFICGFEALLRWQHPEKGLVLPGEFVSVLEEAGLIVPVGEWVLREVCMQVQAWQRGGLAVKPVTVNLSARQFQQKDFEATVRRVLRETRVDPSLIQFELTESLLMSDPEGAARTLRGLKDSGLKIAVDDFGTGYSSLAYLKRFPIDALKIDSTFVRDITTDPEDAMITLAIIGLAHNLRLKVVAEGVETREQLDLLAADGCDEIQGYYFSVPTTAEECAKMLKENKRLA